MKFKLTYIVVTKNKYQYLAITLPQLINSCSGNEEIVVVDGFSTDETKKYLEKQKNEGNIHQFISEPDIGEAHALNKSIFLAQGELITFISDDDIFDFDIIHYCRDFLLSHPNLEAIAGNVAQTGGENLNTEILSYLPHYKNWLEKKSPFAFCGLGLMIRKTAFSKVGLFNTDIKFVDTEFTIRLTKKLNLAYVDSIIAVNFVNSNSNSVIYLAKNQEESLKVFAYHGYTPSKKYSKKLIDYYRLKWVEQVGKYSDSTIEKISVKVFDIIIKCRKYFQINDIQPVQKVNLNEPDTISDFYEKSYKWLKEQNQQSTPKTYYRS